MASLRSRVRAGRPQWSGDVESGMTSMLDLIFNILAYFVVIYVPLASERSFDLAMTPAAESDTVSDTQTTDLPKEVELVPHLNIELKAGPNGELAAIELQGHELPPQMDRFEGQLRRIGGALRVSADRTGDEEASAGEAVLLVASPRLKYRYVLECVEVCTRTGFSKIGFREIQRSPGTP